MPILYIKKYYLMKIFLSYKQMIKLYLEMKYVQTQELYILQIKITKEEAYKSTYQSFILPNYFPIPN